MSEQTDYHGWTIPVPYSESDEDTDEWGEILNALLNGPLDDAVVKMGTLSNRPAAGTADRWYLATDQSPPLLSWDDGTQWVDINSDGTASEFTGNILLIESSNDGKLQLKGTDISGTSGTPEGGYNYIEFYDGDADRQGWFGIDQNGNFEFNPEVDGAGVEVGGSNILTETDEGDGGGINADQVDGVEAERLQARTAQVPLTEIPDSGFAVGQMVHVPSGRECKIWAMGVMTESQTRPTGLQMEAKDQVDGNIFQVAKGKQVTGTPLTTVSGAESFRFHVYNSTGNQQNASGFATFTIV